MNIKGRYKVKEIFGPTLQGEGHLIGTPCAFLRFADCNLSCSFCDTDFAGGEYMSGNEILAALNKYKGKVEWLVITGGEPLMQLNRLLIDALHTDGWKINVETNGMFRLDRPVDHISFCPKVEPHKIRLDFCDSLKILWPDPKDLLIKFMDFPATHRFIQPIEDGHGFNKSVVDVLYEMRGEWRLSPQLHKLIGVK